jgi:Kdo2-lipid IVA lauroyltransferase/acyltransferase
MTAIDARHGWCWWPIRVLIAAFRHMEPDTAARVGADLAAMAFVLGIRRRVVSDNLLLALGLSGRQRRLVAWQSYCAMGCSMLQLWSLADRSESLIRRVQLLTPRHLLRLQQDHGSLLLMTAHLGSWDVAAAGLQQLLGRCVVYARPQRQAAVDQLLNEHRRKLGLEVQLVHGDDKRGALAVMRMMRSRQASVGMLADQGPRREHGKAAWFFEQATWCHHGPAVLAARAGVPVVPGCCLRVGWQRFVIFLGAPIHVQGLSESEAVQRCMDALAAMIAMAPGQYFWHHRRFKYRAEGLTPRARAPWSDPRFLLGE